MELSEEQIALYLKNHPGFFLNHEDLLSELKLAKDDGNTVSLVERQVSVLRERNMEMRGRLTSLIENAQKNDQLFEKTKTLILHLLEGKNLDHLSRTFVHSLTQDFAMAKANLIVFSDEAIYKPTSTKIVSRDEALEHIPGILRNDKAICGVLRPQELKFIFGSHYEDVGSAAVAPLFYKESIGLIAIGSKDPEYFRSSMDTLFLNYIADTLSRLIPNFLAAR